MEAGVAGVSGDSKDRAFWGQYNGMRYQDAYGILNFDYSRLDTSTGTWLDVTGSNLGLQTRDLGVFWSRQGNWTLGGSYDELWSVNPYTVNSGVAGLGTTTPTATYLTGGAGSGYDHDPSTKRQALGVFGSKWLGRNVPARRQRQQREEDRQPVVRHRQQLSVDGVVRLQLHAWRHSPVSASSTPRCRSTTTTRRSRRG